MAVDPEKSAKVTAESSYDIKGCTITLPKIRQIWRVLSEGFDQDDVVNVSTERHWNGITTKISGESVDEVLEGVRNSTFPGDPESIDNLFMSAAFGINHGLNDRRIFARIDQDGVIVNVRGNDPEWVRGRIGALSDLLEESKRKKGAARHLDPNIPWGSVGGTLGFSTAAAFGILHLYDSSQLYIVVLVFTGTVIAGLAIGHYFNSYVKRQTRTTMLLSPQKPREKASRAEKINLVVGIAALAVAVVSAIVQHLDAR